MNEIQQLLASYNELEEEMIRFSTLVKEVMASITMQEFVPEKANTEMMQCIMELNTKQKECLKLYKQANLGDVAPKKMHIMRDQIEKRMNEARKLEYLEAVKKSFLSLYTEDADVEEKLQAFKDKVVTIKVEKYPLDSAWFILDRSLYFDNDQVRRSGKSDRAGSGSERILWFSTGCTYYDQ